MKSSFLFFNAFAIFLLSVSSCKSPNAAESGTPMVSIVPGNLQGVEFTAYTFKAKMSNHPLDETYFVWNMGDDTATYKLNFNTPISNTYQKPGMYSVSVKAYDYYTDSIIATTSAPVIIDTVRSSVEIIPEFYHGSLIST